MDSRGKFADHLAFVDDYSLIAETKKTAQKMVDAAFHVAKQLGVQFIVGKCAVLHERATSFGLEIGDSSLHRVSECKYLAVVLKQNDFEYRSCAPSAILSANLAMNVVKSNIKNSYNRHGVGRILWGSAVRQILEYGMSVIPFIAIDIKTTQHFQVQCRRFVLSATKRVPTDAVLGELTWTLIEKMFHA